MSSDLLLRRKLTLRAHGEQVIFVKKSRESLEHVPNAESSIKGGTGHRRVFSVIARKLLKNLVSALYLRQSLHTFVYI